VSKTGSCLLISSDAFWKFSADEVYEESFGHIFTIYASKNEAVSCKVQTHFGSFHLARYVTKVLGTLSRFLLPQTNVCHEVQTDFGSFLHANFIQKLHAHFLDFCIQKRSCLLLSSDAFWKLWRCLVYEESSGHNFTIDVSKNEAVCC